MTTTAMTQITAKELIQKLMAGERDVSNTRLPADTALDKDDSYAALLTYLKAEDLRANPIKADHVEWRGIKAPGLFIEFASLLGSDLSGAVITDGSFRRIDGVGINFKGANLSRSTFVAARLGEADLTDAILQDADFYESNQAGASYRNADLTRSFIIRTALKDADLTGANLAGVNLYRCDLRGVKGLETTKDLGTASFYRTIITAKEQAAITAAFHARPSFDLRTE